jgi:hypothetical protein
MSPQVAAKNRWARIEALMRNRGFVDGYRDAFVGHMAGLLPACNPRPGARQPAFLVIPQFPALASHLPHTFCTPKGIHEITP